MIHEGTHGIQGLDLLGRKVVMQQGAGLESLAARMTATIARAERSGILGEHAQALASALARLRSATGAAWAGGEPAAALANATPYLQAFGHVVLAWIWLDVALAAERRLADDAAAEAQRGRLQACRYFFRYELPRIDAWLGVVATRDDTCRTMDADWF